MLGDNGDTRTTRTHHLLAKARERLVRADRSVVDDQIAVAQIAAPTGDESRRAAWVADRFSALGLTQVDVDSAGNVIGRHPGRADLPPVAICAHLDTVFPSGTDVTVRRDGDRLIGPGITDNGRGLATMLALGGEFGSGQLPTNHPIEFVATTGEEGSGDLRGAKHYFATRGKESLAAIITDGAGDERIVHQALGSRRFRILFAGPGGHSWSAFGTANPVHAAGAAVTAIAALPLPSHPRTTLGVARIGGGLSINSIPGDAWMEVDLRSSSAAVLRDLGAQIERVVRDAVDAENARRAPDTEVLRARVEIIGDRPCGATAQDHAIVRAAIAATRLVGRSPELAMASTDANVPISLGIPAIAIGGGGLSGDTHTTAEWYDNTAGTIGIARALTIVAVTAELAD